MRLPLLLLVLTSSLIWLACQSTTSSEKASAEVSADTMPNALPTKQTTPTAIPPTPGTTAEATTPTKNDKKETSPTSEKKASTQTTTAPAKTTSAAKTTTASDPAAEPAPSTNTPSPDPTSEQPAPQEEAKESLPAKPNHDAFDALLRKYVSSSGKVDYQGFKADKNALQAYLDDLSAHPPQSDWSRNEKMAFWINAYNAYTIKLIVDNYPVSSITNLHGGKPWDVKWIKIGDKTYTLNNIENDILRPVYKDARIHFAVNCAAKSCPPLHNRAYTSANLNSTLEARTKEFINNSKFNTLNTNSVEVSKIFDWYKADFGNLIDYLNQYATTKINAGANVNFMDYDWGLNN